MTTWIPILSVAVGVLSGAFLLPTSLSSLVNSISTFSLFILLFGVGIDLGQRQNLYQSLRKLGVRILLVPFGVIIGTWLGSGVAGFLLDIPLNQSLAIGSGFGWYSLSGVLLTKNGFLELGTLSFMANLMRELITIVSIPFLAKHLSDLSAIAPGGATTMDTTLPLISQATKSRMTMIAFINGLVLSALVPIFVNFFIRLSF